MAGRWKSPASKFIVILVLLGAVLSLTGMVFAQ
jgi:hypothetical protein